MPGKSYVTLEQHICNVCGQPYDTGSLLLDNRLRERFERTTVTGWGLCPEHQKLYDDGYIALVEVKNPMVANQRDAILKQQDANRTGNIAHIRVSAWEGLFNSAPPHSKGKPYPMCFVEAGMIDRLQSIAQASAGDGDLPKDE